MFDYDDASAIAIIGLAGRFPGAGSIEQFWQNLVNGVESITEFDDKDLLKAGIRPDTISEPHFVKAGAILDDDEVETFDADFFKFSPREARYLDPQHRLFLQCAWEALEDAGCPPDQLDLPVGVFAGSNISHYLLSNLQGHLGSGSLADDLQLLACNDKDYLATHVSYKLNLKGPSLTIQTACSTSLVAVHVASQSLLNGECDIALAGGVSLSLPQKAGYLYSDGLILSPDGHCRPFDVNARGTVQGNGAGIVVLKRLSDAIQARDNIYAVIKGTAINNDGELKVGYTAPSEDGQANVVSEALAVADVSPDSISFIESHGTATALGDPVEIAALQQVFGAGQGRSCALGATKANIGHLGAAAGVAGLIKTALALKHKQIPPHPNYTGPNSAIDFDQTPFFINTECLDWKRETLPRRAGVSSFGVGGTNAHVILEEAPSLAAEEPMAERPWQLLALSAKTDTALRVMAGRYADYLQRHPAASLANLCHSANTGRAQFAHRLAIPSNDKPHLQQALQGYADSGTGDFPHGNGPGGGPVVFLFTGQGAQYPDMGRQLFDTEPRFRAVLQDCEALLRDYLDKPLLSVMYPACAEDAALLDETAYTQPALFALEYALARLWQHWGIEPDILMGHSVGEYVAACLAGVFSLEDGLRLIATRSRLMQALPSGGGMAAVFAPASDLATRIEAYAGQISIAGVNGPEQTVLSGQSDVLDSLLEQWQAEGLRCQRLAVSHAFHSPLLEPMLDVFEEAAKRIHYRRPERALISNLTGDWVSADRVLDAGYWRRHAREAVQFYPGLQTLMERGCQLAIEIGPAPVLTGLLQRSGVARDTLCVASLRQGQADWACLSASLAQVYAQGQAVDWAGVDQPYACRRMGGLPLYPFERKRFWFEDKRPAKNSMHDSIYSVTWRQIEDLPRKVASLEKLESGYWIVIAENHALTRNIEIRLENAGHRVINIFREEYHVNGGNLGGAEDRLTRISRSLQQVLDSKLPLHGVLYISNSHANTITHSSDQINNAVLQINCEVVDIIKAWRNIPIEARFGVWFVTQDGQCIDSMPCLVNPVQTSVWGLARVVANENPLMWGGIADIDSKMDQAGSAAAILEAITSRQTDQIVIREHGRYEPQLTLREIVPDSKPRFNNSKSYLVTGAFGGIGQSLVAWLAKHGAGHIIMVVRQSPQDKGQELLADLCSKNLAHTIVNCDVTREEDLSQLFDRIKCEFPPLAGVFHCAGVVDDMLLVDSTPAQIQKILAPKVYGAWALHKQTCDLSLDYFVMFSSATILFGTPGQGGYAAANNFLDGLAWLRSTKGLPANCISWGAWHQLGMTAAMPAVGQHGEKTIHVDEGMAILWDIIEKGVNSCAVVPMDWQRFSSFLPEGHKALLPKGIHKNMPAGTAQNEQNAASFKLLQQLSVSNGEKRSTILLAFLKQCIVDVAGVKFEQLHEHSNLLDLGLDSLMIMSILASCETQLNLRLYPNEFYRHPQLSDLASYLLNELYPSDAKAPAHVAVNPGLLQNGGSFTSDNKSYGKEKLPGIVFILSSPRSGSTLLRVMLAGHSRLFVPPELHLLPFSDMAERHALLGESHLDEGLARALMELGMTNAEEAQKLVANWNAEKKPVVEVYADLIQQTDRVLVDKSPTYAFNAEVLDRAEQIFDNARYIWITRHPFSVIDSFVKNRMDKLMGEKNGDPYRMAEDIWLKTNSNIQKFFKSVGDDRVHAVRYEDLVASPADTMRAACDFLGVDFEAQLLEPYQGNRMTDGLHKNSLSIGDPNFLKHKGIEPELANKWKYIELPGSLLPATQEMAVSMGYELENTERCRESQIIVPIREPKSNQPLLFCVHPAGGQITAYFKFVENLKLEMGLYGLQSRALRAPKQEFASVEDMARNYIRAIRNVQERGPYYLLGWSMGGRLCLEIASQLEQDDEEIAFLGILDSRYPVEQPKTGIPSVKMGITLAFGGVLADAFDKISTLEQKKLIESLDKLDGDKKIRETIEWGKRNKVLPPQLRTQDLLNQAMLVEQHVNMLHKHVPKQIHTPIHVWWGKEELERRPKTDWSAFTTAQVFEEIVDGTHFSMITPPNIQNLSKCIDRSISSTIDHPIPA